MQKTVVLTGGGGFLAGHIARAFDAAGWRTTGIGRSDPNHQAGRFAAFHFDDLSDPKRIASIFERDGPEALVHLAAPASVPESVRNPREDFRAHVMPTLNVFEAVRIARGPIRVVLISSAAVYGNPDSLPVSESAPLAPISPYGFHKVHQELLLDEYAAIHGVRGCKARLFSTYGENQRRLAVWDIARRAIGGETTVMGSGDETRDYLYAGGAGRAIVIIAERGELRGEAINVSSGEEVSIRGLAAEIFRLAAVNGEPRFTGETLPGSPSRWRADISRLLALGFEPPSWSSGLGRTIEWILQMSS
jgi:UDP-glucose 4-epimerase